ncbi:mitochondrial inner membrane protease atp23 [Hyaloscypha bicolor E]|uniref:Mitochondrial inner membrane protease ATP23 n=1 Tax=Hyaloscypha bicolor E TaxID=1095630 RepID=A0A2J6SWJ4_9HELO|nr:mitochondrial inner membrane protease atp23 [Hyaloscypha bicolor E]PMD55033.1 mitochondrial inner membrane protease atp23 [Hyaloscypha bicolor E]
MAREEQDSFVKPQEQENPGTANGHDPAQTGYDPESPWTNIYNILTGRMTPIGQHYFREDKYIQNEARDCKSCDEWRDWCFKYSPTVIFLRKNIEALNGDLNAKNVRCRRCPTRRTEDGGFVRQGGGFSPDHGILICANEMRDRKHLEDTLAHEMVHAWDHLRWKVDWADLRHAACTEIRASSLSGECRFMREFWTRNNWKLTQQHQNCVRTRAVKSVMARPACKDDVQAVKVVNEVWDSCFSDTRPFDEIYR